MELELAWAAPQFVPTLGLRWSCLRLSRATSTWRRAQPLCPRPTTFSARTTEHIEQARQALNYTEINLNADNPQGALAGVRDAVQQFRSASLSDPRHETALKAQFTRIRSALQSVSNHIADTAGVPRETL